MNNKPFRFLDSKAALGELAARLSQIGVQIARDNECEICVFRDVVPDSATACLRWEYNWWPDGIQQKDATVSLIMDNRILQTLDVADLLHQRLHQPLLEEIIDRLFQMISGSIGGTT